ncbi:MAG: AMP-binding protein [Deltaproteobacteria bacterium]|nr:AMP-binding protein [Deltaproteobacteria bacterium]
MRAGWSILKGKAQDSVRGLKLLRQSGVASAVSITGAARFALAAARAGLGPHLASTFHALNGGDKLAVESSSRRLSYAELDAEVNRLARGLEELGVSHGDRVAVMLPNRLEHLVAQLAVPRIGARTVEIGYRLKAPEVAFILGNSRPRVLIHDAAYQQVALLASADAGHGDARVVVGDRANPCSYEQLLAGQSTELPRAARRGNDGGVIVYTSGTTGNPKGADRSLGDVSISAVVDFMVQVGMRHDDRHLVVCPLYHSAAPAFCAMMLGLGANITIADHFDPIAILELIERRRLTSAFMVPTMLQRLAEVGPDVIARYDCSSLRWVCSGAAPLSTATARAFQDAFGYLLWNFYGATETGLVTLAGPFEHATKPGTVGKALAGNELRIVGDGGRMVATGEVGEVYARNGMLIRGYHDNQQATDDATLDGFFSVGDLGRLDDEGYLYLASRKHDMIISGGVNIYPREIENHLLTHPSISDVAVLGAPDPEWGETVKAFIVVRPGTSLSESEIDGFCRQGLADYKRPRRIEFLAELPRNATGKVLKRELRER